MAWLLPQPHFALFLFHPLDLSFDDFTDERSATLLPDEVVDPFAHSFRESNYGGFHF
ncbi:hypothetical protein [Sphingopyxis sp. JAI128]|uniref:hypothetical protein n=1 Tax=Sphingopyxis sp. JAI128 TaxID=2723066 RepID=UPI0016130938|nr:hypothetical protein [Sphingopyxis sp. JAI128]MBB6428027.1 hypothetical protein [Sphingopyxis sp. JAI128]